MRVLITGGCGMIGYAIAKHNKTIGNEVIVIDNLERSSLLGHEVDIIRKEFNQNKLKKLKIPVINSDVSDPSTFADILDIDAIFHMAAQCGVPPSIANPRRDFEVNTIGTFNVLELARKTGAAVIYASTNKVYPLHDMFTKEGNRWRFQNDEFAKWGFPESANYFGARTPYGTSKYCGDLLCQEYSYTYGIRTGVFRMSCIYGPNQFGFEEQGWATWFLIATMKGWPITIFGDGDQVRDMLHVTDVVDAYMCFLNSDIKHGIWNLGGGPENTLSLHDHLNICEQLFNKRSQVEYKDWRPLDQKAYISDTRKVKWELDWLPSINPYNGLKDVSEWVDSNLSIF